MTPGLTSIIIPTYNHATFLPDAIESALAQTARCEVIVVDDGSRDNTVDVVEPYLNRIRFFQTAHRGPCVARNLGIDRSLGEFIMFLDADDVIEPTKIEEQLAAFSEEIGWVLCDVKIEDEAKNRTVLASQQYDYHAKGIGGWIGLLLAASNFIPIMSPLVRRSALGNIRFTSTRLPEDWYFWQGVARCARVRYVPRVLATYRHRKVGRSRVPSAARNVSPTLVRPWRLNLGCGTPDTGPWHPIPQFVNLDKSLGWRFEDGLTDFPDRSVEAITISHSLMYVKEADWPRVFAEFARVLMPGGVIRITEDSTADPASSRVGGWQGSQPAVTLTSPEFVVGHLERAGLQARVVGREETAFRDASLCQAQHGQPPDVFFVEGIKPSCVLFSPHNDDETLFAAFTIVRHRPSVVVCFQSERDYGDPAVREAETRAAVEILGGGPVEQWNGGDLEAQMRELDERQRPSIVWAPHPNAIHEQHCAVSTAASRVFGDRVVHYDTYQGNEHGVVKVRGGDRVPYEPEWVERKLRALLRYESQVKHPRASIFFTWDLEEYIAR